MNFILVYILYLFVYFSYGFGRFNQSYLEFSIDLCDISRNKS